MVKKKKDVELRNQGYAPGRGSQIRELNAQFEFSPVSVLEVA